MTPIVVTPQPDGSLFVEGYDSPDVLEWAKKHGRQILIAMRDEPDPAFQGPWVTGNPEDFSAFDDDFRDWLTNPGPDVVVEPSSAPPPG